MAKVVTFPGNPAWASGLITTENGLRHKSVHNAFLLFENIQDLAGAFRLNLYTEEIELIRPVPWSSDTPRAISEIDLVNACNWLEQQQQFGFNDGLVYSVLRAVASKSAIDPLADWLNSLKWDSVPRIDNLLTYYFGVEETEYTKLIGPKFMLGAVARVLRPGCKVDTMLILEGPQGGLKSSSMEALFGPDNFTDEISDFGSKDAAMQLQGVWGIEVAELSTFKRAAAERAKEFLSRRQDRFRLPYGRTIVKKPRRAVLIGTTNADAGYFEDHTGNRRYWPVRAGSIDIEAIRSERAQLWAEAVSRFKSGERWWLEGDEHTCATAEQSDRYDEDIWQSEIEEHITARTQVTVREILVTVFKFEEKDLDQRLRNRVSRCLSVLGWACPKPEKVNGKATRVYRPRDLQRVLL